MPRLTNKHLAAGLLMGLAFFSVSAQAQKETRPTVPDAMQPPQDEQIVLKAHGSGVQIYSCQGDGSGKFSWALKAPQANLMDGKGKVIGEHSAGPTWKLTDGSEVDGKAAAHADSPDSLSIPWLLINAAGHSGNGLLTNVTHVQRVNTQGGKAPAEGCDASHQNAETQSNYGADYYFYAPAK